MQSKTIKKNISMKLDEWLASIDDNNLAKDVRKNILVSGGSIASMLLKEDVNDYDIYIKDMDVLIRLAKYYCPSKVLDGRLRDDYLKSRWPDIKDGLMFDGTKYLAEEYVRVSNLKKDQVKLDIPGAGMRFNVKAEEGKDPEKYQLVFLSQNAISLSDDIQIVLRFHGDSNQIHKTFDFIHSTNYFTFEEGLVLNNRAMESLLTKQLSYQGSLYPLTSIIRMKKFLGRGFNINAGEILKIMYQISLLDLNDIEVMEEQLIGVDVAYFSMLIDAIRKLDGQKLDANFMNQLIDKIFNEYDAG